MLFRSYALTALIGQFGQISLDVSTGAPATAADRELLAWIGAALVPVARIALQIDVPPTPRP